MHCNYIIYTFDTRNNQTTKNMNNQFSNNSTGNESAMKKLLREVCNLLFFASCVLTILVVASRSSFDIKQDVETKGWGKGSVYVSVSIADKITGGLLCYSNNGDVLNNSGTINSNNPIRDVLSMDYGEAPIMSEANVAKIKEATMKHYSLQATLKIAICAVVTAILFFLRKRMKKQTTK